MAKQTLPVNFKDDILSSSMGGKRRYNLIQNSDGTYSLEDATDYTQTGSDFGAGQINATNKAVNESCDKADVIDSLDDILANQANGKIAGAKAVAELYGNLSKNNRGNTDYLYKVGYSCFLHTGGTLASSVVSTLPANYRPSRAVTVSGWCRNLSTGRYFPCMGLISTDGTWSYLCALTALNSDSGLYFIFNRSDSTNNLSNYNVWIHGAWATNTNGS